MNNRGSNRSKKGQMPMAMIAVALLISGAFFCVITKDIEESTNNSESLTDEIDAMDDEIQRTEMQLEASIGNIVSDLGQSPEMETGLIPIEFCNLINLSELFDERCEELFNNEYPAFNRGITATIESHELVLSLEPMKVGSEFEGMGAEQFTFLRATGTVTVCFSSESTSTIEPLDIVADATSCLPLIAGAATEFELSLEGSNSILAQMVEYQLTTLAQNRIMNGYGSMGTYGANGTEAIITEKDVLKAFRIGLDVLESMHFRHNASNDRDLLCNTQIDLGDAMVIRDGKIEINVGMLYAQAIESKLDHYVEQWMSYIGTDFFEDLIDFISDKFQSGVRTLVNFIFDKDLDEDKAKDLIESNMDDIGKGYLLRMDSPGKATLEFGGCYITVTEDNETREVYLEPRSIEFDLPSRDVLDWDGWGDTYHNHKIGTNQFRDQIKNILREITTRIKNDNYISIPIDQFDGETYYESMYDEVRRVLIEGERKFLESSKNTVNGSNIPDQFMAVAYQTIVDKRYEIFGTEELLKDLENSITSYAIIDSTIMGLPQYVEEFRSSYLETSNHLGIQLQHKESVDRHVDRLSCMTSIKDGCNNKFIEGLASTIGKGLDIFHLSDNVARSAIAVLEDMVSLMGDEPEFKLTELPGKEEFTLVDGESGYVYTERMTVSDMTSISIELKSPRDNKGRNIHYVDFTDWGGASFSAIYGVRIDGDMTYDVRSSNTLLESVGGYDSGYHGTVRIDMELDIPLISGWALNGVSYENSTTLIKDLWKAVFNLIQPYLDDLMNVFRAMKELENIMSTALLEFSNKITEMINKVYEVLNVPLELLRGMVNELVQRIGKEFGLKEICLKLTSQKLTFDFFGTTIIVETDVRSWDENTKNVVKVTAIEEKGGMTTTASCSVKHNASKGYYAIIEGGAKGGDWGFNLTFDPLMATRPYYVGITGNVRDINYSGTMPEIVQYNKIQLALSDIDGVGKIMDNITLIPGTKCSLDAGVYLKYGLPIKNGILINEVELNPSGNDAGNEWAEIYNNTDRKVNLFGYTIVPASGDKKAYNISEKIELEPKEKVVITFKSQTLNNKASKGLPGERLYLYDTQGQLLDMTDWLTDENNNEYTNQRTSDGFVSWGLSPGTPDAPNGNKIPGGILSKDILMDKLKDAVAEEFDKFDNSITDKDMLLDYIKNVIANIMNKMIGMLANTIVEACVFLKAEFEDVTGSLGTGIKVMLGIDSGIVEEMLTRLAGTIPIIGQHVLDASGMTEKELGIENIWLKTIVYTGISAPDMLEDVIDIGKLETGVTARMSLSTIGALMQYASGDEITHQWHVEAGIVMEDFPTVALPDRFKAVDIYDSDLWLIRMDFSKLIEDEVMAE